MKFSLKHIVVSLALALPLMIGGCMGGGAGSGGAAGGLAGDGRAVFGYASLRSKERILLKQNLNTLSMKVSILTSASPSQIKSASRARSIASALQGVANNLVGVMPRSTDAGKFAHFAQMMGQQNYDYAFVPVVTAKMINFQAAYLNVFLQYLPKVIYMLREPDVKILLAILQTSKESLSGVAV